MGKEGKIMTRKQRTNINTAIRYILHVMVGILMVYPLICMVGATFKTNSEIFYQRMVLSEESGAGWL